MAIKTFGEFYRFLEQGPPMGGPPGGALGTPPPGGGMGGGMGGGLPPMPPGGMGPPGMGGGGPMGGPPMGGGMPPGGAPTTELNPPDVWNVLEKILDQKEKGKKPSRQDVGGEIESGPQPEQLSFTGAPEGVAGPFQPQHLLGTPSF